MAVPVFFFASLLVAIFMVDAVGDVGGSDANIPETNEPAAAAAMFCAAPKTVDAIGAGRAAAGTSAAAAAT